MSVNMSIGVCVTVHVWRSKDFQELRLFHQGFQVVVSGSEGRWNPRAGATLQIRNKF